MGHLILTSLGAQGKQEPAAFLVGDKVWWPWEMEGQEGNVGQIPWDLLSSRQPSAAGWGRSHIFLQASHFSQLDMLPLTQDRG